ARAVALRGVAYDWARKLPSLLAEHGLTTVNTECRVDLFNGASASAKLWQVTFAQVREQLLAVGASADEFETNQNLLCDATQWFVGPAMIGAWGCRSAAV